MRVSHYTQHSAFQTVNLLNKKELLSSVVSGILHRRSSIAVITVYSEVFRTYSEVYDIPGLIVKEFFCIHDRKALSALSQRIREPGVANLYTIVRIQRCYLIWEMPDLFFADTELFNLGAKLPVGKSIPEALKRYAPVNGSYEKHPGQSARLP